MGRLATRILLLLCISTPSFAEDYTELAKTLYKAGEQYLEADQYEKAIEAYKEGYELSQKPAFLYNIAVVYIRLEDFNSAHETLLEYRRLSDSSEWLEIDELIASIEPRLTVIEETTVNEHKETVPVSTPEPEPEPEVSKQEETTVIPPVGEKSKSARYALLGTSSALTITGSILAIKNRQIHTQIDNSCVNGICPNLIDGSPMADKLQQEKNLALAADISIAVGVVGIGTGLILLNSQSGPNQWSVHNNTLIFQRSF